MYYSIIESSDILDYDEHTHQADMIPGVSISYQTAL